MSRIDPVLWLLFFGLVFFTGVLLAVAHFDATDGQTFQVVSSLVAGFAGSFFTRLKPAKTEPQDESVSTTTITTRPIPVVAVEQAKEPAALTNPPSEK